VRESALAQATEQPPPSQQTIQSARCNKTAVVGAPPSPAALPLSGWCFQPPVKPQRANRHRSEATLGVGVVDLTRAVEELATPAYVIDRDGRLRWVNAAYVDLIGDRRGQSFLEVVAPEDRHLARTNFARKVVSKASTIFDVRVVVRTGEQLTLRITSVPLRRGEDVVGVFGVGVPLEAPAAATGGSKHDVPELTPRQREVLRLLSEGLETHEIAVSLGIADETARNHIRALLRAIGAHSRLEAVLIGLRLGMVVPQLTQPGDDPS
jgi:DNA-binding CsgD family transcriptional regulator